MKWRRGALKPTAIRLMVTTACLIGAAFAGAQSVDVVVTVGEFLTMKDSAKAVRLMENSYSIALNKQVNLFRAKGYNGRADYIINLKPNLKELYTRFGLAHVENQNADMVAVIRGYLIDASSPATLAEQAHQPAVVPKSSQ